MIASDNEEQLAGIGLLGDSELSIEVQEALLVAVHQTVEDDAGSGEQV